MSWRAMEAVQDFSRFQEQRDYAAFRTLLALASFADENGIVGAPGDYRSCPGHRAIAARAHLHRNTVGNVLPMLLESGELAIVEQGGSKRGTWTVYRICLPMDGLGYVEGLSYREGDDVPKDDVLAQASREAEDKSLRELVEVMAHVLAQVSADMAQVREVMAQGFGTFGTTAQRDAVPDPITDPMDPVDPGDPDARENGHGEGGPGRPELPPIATPATVVGEGESKKSGLEAAYQDGRRDPRKRELARRAGAIAEVCGLDMRVASHRARCEEAAAQLEGAYPGDRFGEAFILARYGAPTGAGGSDWNWYLHDWRGRKGEQPEPRWVVETIGKVWQGEGMGNANRPEEGGLQTRPYSNNEATARQYAELRRKFVKE